MAANIVDMTGLVESLVDPAMSNLPLNSKKIIGWKCGGCGGKWKESVSKRATFKHCPECSPDKKRTAKVTRSIATPVFTCTICYLELMIRSTVTCPYCDFECCKDCLTKYILSGIGRARCIAANCGKEFTMHQMVTLFDKKWVMDRRDGGYLHHLNKVAIDAEKAKIPTTLPLVKLYENLDKNCLKRRAIYSAITRLEKKYGVEHMQYIPREGQSELLVLDEKLKILSDENNAIRRQIDGDEKIEINTEIYIQGCPVGECRGLINSKYECEICGVKLCRNCRVALNESSHTCDPDIAASVASMKDNTKACPKCGISIYKIDGCDQMWCVECKTAFSWNTGRIETGGIHNPHYFQWLRERKREVPRTPGDEICGGLPAQEDILSLIDGCEKSSFWEVPFGRIYAKVRVDYTQLSNENRRDKERCLQIYRVEYLRGKYSEGTWYDQIQKTYIEMETERVEQEIMASMKIVLREKIIELYQELKAGGPTIETLNKFEAEFDAIRVYINRCIAEENAHRYSASFYGISVEWDFEKFSHVKRESKGK